MMGSQISDTSPPLLRGYLHLVGAIVAPFALLLLLFIADSPRGIVGGAIFGASLIILYSTSATYHLLPLGRRLRGLVRRLDHSNIYVFIAGAYTPFALKLLSNAWGIPVLSVVWGLAGVGIIITLAAPAAPRWIRVGLYLVLGWIGIVAISELVTALPGEAFAMLVLSGILFSIGGAIYATRRPDPFPSVFGYHEMFHSLQVAATAMIYSVVAIYVLPS
jgi:hemolysin III